jgi:hypothetical protein
MKTNKNHRPHPPTRPTPPRPAHDQPTRTRPPRPAAEFLDFCMYPGMKGAIAPIAYPTAV